MHYEIERRFLLEFTAEIGTRLQQSQKKLHLSQGYILPHKDHGFDMRIRSAVEAINDSAGTTQNQWWLTVKGPGQQKKIEVEVPLTEAQFLPLWALTEGRRIEKTRYHIPLSNEATAELDQYHAALTGFWTVEVEFNSSAAADAFVPPPWFGAEITADDELSNAKLARYGLPERYKVLVGSGRMTAACYSTVLPADTAPTSAAASKTALDKYLPKLFYGSSHVWALKQLEQLPLDATVLDIGPGSGIIGATLRQRGITQLYGIESDPAARTQCAAYYTEVVPPGTALSRNQFDAVILLDVLEHMATPEEFLTQICTQLRPGGLLLISVPNLYHWSIRICLALGILEYTDRGIFERTHLQFFSPRRLSKMVAAAGCDITERNASISPAQFVLGERIGKTKLFHWFCVLRQWCAWVWPSLGAYQFLIAARKHR